MISPPYLLTDIVHILKVKETRGSIYTPIQLYESEIKKILKAGSQEVKKDYINNYKIIKRYALNRLTLY